MQSDVDFESDGWSKKVDSTKPNVETEAAVLEIRELKKELGELKNLIENIKGGANGGG